MQCFYVTFYEDFYQKIEEIWSVNHGIFNTEL